MSTIIKCKSCEAAGTPYKLSYGGMYPRTCAAYSPFVDNDGKRHYHDGNSGGSEYWNCSNGHAVTPEQGPSCWCGWPITGAWADADRQRRKLIEERLRTKAVGNDEE